MVDPYGIAIVPASYLAAVRDPGGESGPRLWGGIADAGEPTVAFEVPSGGDVRIELYDVAGRRLASDVLVAPGPGRHRHAFTGARLEPGVYLVRLEAAGRVAMARLVRLR